jgi:hypothetical protein
MHNKPKCILYRRKNMRTWTAVCSCTGHAEGSAVAQPGDVIVSRVGRGCADSFGAYAGTANVSISDCVFLIRPLKQTSLSSRALLLACRTVASHPNGRRLLERGTGASFIAHSELKRLRIPTKIGQVSKSAYGRYQKAMDLGKPLRS